MTHLPYNHGRHWFTALLIKTLNCYVVMQVPIYQSMTYASFLGLAIREIGIQEIVDFLALVYKGLPTVPSVPTQRMQQLGMNSLVSSQPQL